MQKGHGFWQSGLGTSKYQHLADGARFSAGASPGVLEVAGDLLAQGEILVEIAGPDRHDLIQVGGIADLAGATLHFVLVDGARADDLAGLTFLTAAGGILGLEHIGLVFGEGLEGYRVALADNALYLAPVPEPATWALVLAGLGLVGRRRARPVCRKD